jgi:chemotaxis protein methyltransferase CheR
MKGERFEAMKLLRIDDLSDAELLRIGALVKSTAGINLHEGKKELIRARLTKRLRELGLRSFTEYLEYIKRSRTGEEFSIMLDVLSTNVTTFFREADHLKHLGEKILPRIMSHAHKRGRRVRIWSAGCSSGEEPYSVAIMVADKIPSNEGWDVKILATDLSTRVLEKARHGVYPTDRIKDVPPMLRQKYFNLVQRKPDPLFQVSDELREKVYFARLNLMGNWPMKGPFDVIFCRNVMIYFDKPTREKLVHRYWEMLSPGGVLFIGHSESLTGTDHAFKFIQPTVYMK